MFKAELPPDGGQESKEKLSHEFHSYVHNSDGDIIYVEDGFADPEVAKSKVKQRIIQLRQKNTYKNQTLEGAVDETIDSAGGTKQRVFWICSSNDLDGRELNEEFE